MKKLLAILLCLMLMIPVFAVAEDTVEIELWTYPIGSWGDQATVDALIADFNAAYPNIKVKVQFIDYQTNMAVQISKIITGERPVDDWDEILEGWYAAGGDSYVAEMRAYITENQNK